MNPTTRTFVEQADLFSDINSTCRPAMPGVSALPDWAVMQIAQTLALHRLLRFFRHEFMSISRQRKVKERTQLLVGKTSNKGLTLSPVIIS
jgi:hypothetical protein